MAGGLVAATLIAGCADDGSGAPSDGNDPLTFQRSNQSTVTFAGTAFAWCGPWEEELIPEQALHIIVGFDPAQPSETAPYWSLKAVLADVALGIPNDFPNDFIWDQPEGVSFFVYDPPNELSSAEEEATGSLTFHRLDCSVGGQVEFTIDAVLGSEFAAGDSLVVTGYFQTIVGQRPY